MSVKELIEILRQFPENAEVVAYNSVDGEDRSLCVYGEGPTGEQTSNANAVKVAMVI